MADECIQIMGGMGFMKVQSIPRQGGASVQSGQAHLNRGFCVFLRARNQGWSVCSEIFESSGSLKGQMTFFDCLWLCKAVW